MMKRLLIVLIVVTGCQLSQSTVPTVTTRPTAASAAADETVAESATPLTEAATTVAQAAITPAEQAATAVEVASQPTTANTVVPYQAAAPGGNILVWLGSGSSPESAGGGQIGMIDTSGTVTPIFDLPPTTNRVTACGDQATSPDGRFFTFFAGIDEGTLYLMDSTQAPIPVDEVSYLACVSSFRYAPNSERFAYIDYVASATTNDFPEGTLRIYNSASHEEVENFDNVTAFDIDNGGAVLVQFFTNSEGEADEAAVILWDGSAQNEIVTLVPTEPECRFTSARIGLRRTQLLAVMGQRCKTGDTSPRWQLYTIDAVVGSATLVATDAQPAGFVSFARTNNLFFAPNESTAYFTVPDGVTAYTVAVAAVSLDDLAITVPVPRQAVFPNFSGAENAFPRLSPDGRWLAMVMTSPNNENQLLALDLNAPETAPIGSAASGRGDIIPNLEFSADGSSVLYVSGGEDNALFALNLSLGSEERIVRGRFARGMVVAPDGKTVVLLDQQEVEDPRQPTYLDLVLADLETKQLTTIFEGAEVTEDGKVNDPHFAFPLAWR